MSSHDSLYCPICGNLTSPKFTVPCDYRKPSNSDKYEISWCQECDYGMISYRPSKQEVAQFYDLDEYYTHHSEQFQDSKDSVSFFDRLRIHLSYRFDNGEDLDPNSVRPLVNSSQSKICEIGCGNGNNLAKFQELGYEVYGVEPDLAARKMAQQVTSHVFPGTAEELPSIIREQKFDIVLMSHVLEHCLDINAAIHNVKQILKDKGVFIVEIPNCNSLGFKAYQGEWPWSDIPRHLNFFTPSSSNKVLKKHGFEVRSVKYSGFCRQFSNDWLHNEKEIWQAFSQYSSKSAKQPNFRSRSWKLLLKSVFASDENKYDSIRLVGVKD